MSIMYELYQVNKKYSGIYSITKYKYSELEKAKAKQKQLNQGLRYKGYTDIEYVLYKVERTEIK